MRQCADGLSGATDRSSKVQSLSPYQTIGQVHGQHPNANENIISLPMITIPEPESIDTNRNSYEDLACNLPDLLSPNFLGATTPPNWLGETDQQYTPETNNAFNEPDNLDTPDDPVFQQTQLLEDVNVLGLGNLDNLLLSNSPMEALCARHALTLPIPNSVIGTENLNFSRSQQNSWSENLVGNTSPRSIPKIPSINVSELRFDSFPISGNIDLANRSSSISSHRSFVRAKNNHGIPSWCVQSSIGTMSTITFSEAVRNPFGRHIYDLNITEKELGSGKSPTSALPGLCNKSRTARYSGSEAVRRNNFSSLLIASPSSKSQCIEAVRTKGRNMDISAVGPITNVQQSRTTADDIARPIRNCPEGPLITNGKQERSSDEDEIQTRTTAKDRKRLERHDRRAQGRTRCLRCGETFLSQKEKKKHVLQEHINGEFPCDLCASVLRSAENLRRHKMTHTEDDSFKCEFCGGKFKTAMSVSMHKKRTHFTEPKRKRKRSEGSEAIAFDGSVSAHTPRPHKSRYPCSMCTMTFLSKQSVGRHIRITHLNERPYRCRFCEKRFSSNHNRNLHIFKEHENENVNP